MSAAALLNSIDAERIAANYMGDGCNYSITWQDSVEYGKYEAFSKSNPLDSNLYQKLLAINDVDSILLTVVMLQ